MYFAEIYSWRFDAKEKISGRVALAIASDAIYVVMKKKIRAHLLFFLKAGNFRFESRDLRGKRQRSGRLHFRDLIGGRSNLFRHIMNQW